MANEYLEILQQGAEAWKVWREKYPEIKVDLEGADLEGANLIAVSLDYADLSGANLESADLNGASLIDADLSSAILDDASLIEVNFAGANLEGASLVYAKLIGANLERSNLDGARLAGADLEGASLDEAKLEGAELDGANLTCASLTSTSLDCACFDRSSFLETVIANVDLRKVHGLKNVRHDGPSVVDSRTLTRSLGKVPKEFLRGCGLSDWEIEAAKLHNPNLSESERTDIAYKILQIQGESPIQINPLFISYSKDNAPFVETLEKGFNEKRVRYWRDVHDMKAGRLETQIDQAIRNSPIVLLVLSEASVESDWVEWEVSKARELERKEKRNVLCPVALDEAWKTCSWPGPLRRQIEDYNILDFSRWQDDAVMERQFQKLIDGLGMFYPKPK